MIDSTATEDEIAVDAFTGRIADDTKRADYQTLLRLGQSVTGEPARIWGERIVGFGRFHYQYSSGREGDAPLLSFSPRATALTPYLGVGGMERFQSILDRLGCYRTGVGCLYVNRLADIDLAVLTELAEVAVSDCRARYPDSSGNQEHVSSPAGFA